jgi:hypothetical protein
MAKLNSKNGKTSLFHEEKSLVGLTLGGGMEWAALRRNIVWLKIWTTNLTFFVKKKKLKLPIILLEASRLKENVETKKSKNQH